MERLETRLDKLFSFLVPTPWNNGMETISGVDGPAIIPISRQRKVWFITNRLGERWGLTISTYGEDGKVVSSLNYDIKGRGGLRSASFLPCSVGDPHTLVELTEEVLTDLSDVLDELLLLAETKQKEILASSPEDILKGVLVEFEALEATGKVDKYDEIPLPEGSQATISPKGNDIYYLRVEHHGPGVMHYEIGSDVYRVAHGIATEVEVSRLEDEGWTHHYLDLSNDSRESEERKEKLLIVAADILLQLGRLARHK